VAEVLDCGFRVEALLDAVVDHGLPLDAAAVGAGGEELLAEFGRGSRAA